MYFLVPHLESVVNVPTVRCHPVSQGRSVFSAEFRFLLKWLLLLHHAFRNLSLGITDWYRISRYYTRCAHTHVLGRYIKYVVQLKGIVLSLNLSHTFPKNLEILDVQFRNDAISEPLRTLTGWLLSGQATTNQNVLRHVRTCSMFQALGR